jgi:hypothetical protein
MVAFPRLGGHRFVDHSFVYTVQAFRPRIGRTATNDERVWLCNCLIQEGFGNSVRDGGGTFANQMTLLLDESSIVPPPAVLTAVFAPVVLVWHVRLSRLLIAQRRPRSPGPKPVPIQTVRSSQYRD